MGLTDFKIEEKVGKGSYGSVYKCTRKSDGTPLRPAPASIASVADAHADA